MQKTLLLALCATALATPAFARAPAPDAAAPQPPSVVFGDLYRAVEMAQVFPDQKTFADAIPTEAPTKIMAAYEAQKSQAGFDLKAFVAKNFKAPKQISVSFDRKQGETVSQYISAVWPLLERKPDEKEKWSSLLPLPYPYIVPGGRFREIYYWDTYFTMLGLEQDGQDKTARNMVRNIAYLIHTYGHMPNGNRSYYLSRSQPPFFSCMVDLLAEKEGKDVYKTFLPEMQREYDYWMQGADQLQPGQAKRNVVMLKDGTILNRYWDARDTPRDESYREDVETSKKSSEKPAVLYRDLRAGAESGWDYSSRWLADGKTLGTIDTLDIVPVDLNAEMFHLESDLAYAYKLKGDKTKAQKFADLAARRKAAIQHLLWDAKGGAFGDYDWKTQTFTGVLSAATMVPLFFHAATDDQAKQVGKTVETYLMGPGGILTTTTDTGQQWDEPNGWAPLQWMAVQGFRAYGLTDMARTIAMRWEMRVEQGFAQDGVLVEKYNVVAAAGAPAGGHGGEYSLQVGFGWTNGVMAALMAEYPEVPRAAGKPGG